MVCWFTYSGGFANYQIGYDLTGGQAEYAANSMLTINDSGNAFFKGYVSATSFRPTNIVTNRIVKFDGTDLDDSIMSDDGSTVTVSGNLDVSGNIDGNITGTAERAEAVDSNDTRGTNDLPNSRQRGVYFDFKSNATNGLSDGGAYNGQMTWRSYGGGSDLSGGQPIQISYTASGRLWSRMGTGATSWGSWRQVLDSVSQPYAYNMNQNVRTSDSPQFARVNIDNTNNYIDTISNYLSFKSGGNEMTFGGSTSMYINYRAALGGTPTHWIWNAGSSSSFARFSLGRLDADSLYDRNNTGYYLNPASTSNLNGLIVNSTIVGNTNGNRSKGNISIGPTSNNSTKWSSITGTQYAHTAEPEGFSMVNGLATSTYNAVYIGGALNEQNAATRIGFYTGAGTTTRTGALKMLIEGDNVIIGQGAISYTNSDNTPLVGSKTNSKLHINGGIQLTNNNDAIVFGRGTSTFMKDEEIGFGWGGGLYMTDGTYLRVRNNKILYSTGEFRGSLFRDVNSTGYYVDPASTSNVNNLTVQGTLTLNGDVNLGDDFTVGSLKTVAINTTIAASGNQARRFEIARISMDYNDWNGTGTFEVELHENYYGRGTVKKYQVFWGYNNAYQLRLVDANIYGNNHFRVVIGSPVTISGDIRYVPVYAEARYYTQCKAIIRTTRDVTYTDNTPNRSWAYINKSPGAQNISDFGTADRIIYKTEADLAADKFYDANNISYYGDFGSTSRFNRTDANDSRADIFYDRNDTNYYLNPASTSVLANIYINDNIYHNGDTNTYMGFHTNDQWRVVTAGGERLEVNNSGIQVQGSVYLNNTSTRLVEGGGNALRIETNTGYIDIGSMNSGWIHFQGNRNYYFNREGAWDATFRPYSNNNRLLGTSSYRWSNVYAQLGNFAGNLDAGTFRDRDNTAYYVNPASTSRINNLDVISKRTDFSASSGWDAIGFGNATNLHMNGHNQFWFGAGNGTWFTGTANSKSQASGLAADASQAHDLLISTMQGTSATDRGITFGVDTSGAGTGGWRLGKWHSGNSRASSLLAIDGTLVAKGGNTDEYDYYANDYSSYYNDGQPNWAGDSGAGWHKPSIVASSAIQIQSGNGGTNSRKPQIQFHQYGYGGPAIEYDGPNKKLQIGMIGTSTANRFNTFALKFGSNEAFVVNTDYASHNSDFRAPIFYDSNDTGFYVNPRSNSIMSGLRLRGIDNNASGDDALLWLDKPNNNDWGIILTGDDDYGIDLRMASTHNYAIRVLRGGSEAFKVNSDYAYHYSDMRSPIFYDSNSTGYYLDPASTSNLYTVSIANQLNVAGQKVINNRNMHVGSSTNLATSEDWVVTTGNGAAALGGGFGRNGDGNSIIQDYGPFGRPSLVWRTLGNDSTSNADGGWNKTVSNLDGSKSYMYSVYVKRDSSSTNGTFYIGCSGSETLNMSGSTNTNPYFTAFGISGLPQGVWCLVVGILHANNHPSTSNSGQGGVWRLDTGQKLRGTTDFKMRYTGTRNQTHRTYLYYSTDPAAHLKWWGPGVHEMNGNEPNIGELSGGAVVNKGQTVDGDIYANRYYDKQSTGYYLDPASTSILNDVRGDIFYDKDSTGYYVRPGSTSRLNTANITTLNTYGTTTLGDGNNDTTNINDTLKLWATDSGDAHFYFGENSANGYGDHYYWDSGYTSYHYSRYAGTDTLISRHDTRYTDRITYGRNISFDDYGKGITGRYSASRYQLVFSMGDAYQLPDNGTSTGNLYGMAWSHPNAGGAASNLNDHGLLFLTNGGFRAAISSRAVFTNEVRGTLFRDYNNSGYYVDPASTSILYNLNVNGTTNLNGNIGGTPNFVNVTGPVISVTKTGSGGTAGNSTTLLVENTYANHSWGVVAEFRGGGISGTDRPAIIYTSPLSSTSWATGYYQTSNNFAITQDRGWRNGGWGTQRLSIDTNGIAYIYNQLRTPIVYDYNNTGRYLDANSTSVLQRLKLVNNVNNNPRWDFTAYVMEAQHWYGNNSSQTMYLGESNYINIRSTADIWGSARAPIYYDRDDTGYYIDAASTSRLKNLRIEAGHGDTRLQLFYQQGNPIYDSHLTLWASEPGITYDNSGIGGNVHFSGQYYGRQSNSNPYAAYVRFDVNGGQVEAWTSTGSSGSGGGQGTRQWWVNQAGDSQSRVSSRAPIFYDSNNTGYYFNGASTSKWNTSNQDGYHTFNNYGIGVTGTYTSTRLQLVFAMGSSYRPNSAGSATANMYGIGWSHPNAGGLGGANNLTDHGLLIINNGSFRAALSNSLVVTSEVKGTLFRDYNNTGYYVDPASTSILNFARINNLYDEQERRFTSPSGGTYTTSSSVVTGAIRIYLPANRRRSNTMHRFRVTLYEYSTGKSTSWEIGGYNYGNGQWYNQFATQLTDSGKTAQVIRWGDDGSRQWCSIGEANQTWSYPQVHITDLQVGYSGFSSNWGNGWTVNFGAIPGGENRSRTASLVLTSNNASNYNGDLYANRFYDKGNTGYYGDFASTSYMNDVRANIYYERENTAYYFGSSQGDFRFRNGRMGSVTIEDSSTLTSVNGNGRIYMGGNFHIDAYNGNDIYVNYYSNRRFRVWNGSSNESFRVDTNRIVYAFSQLRTPILYDNNDSSYYVDPNSISRMYQQRLLYRLHIGDETNLHNAVLQETRRPEVTIKGQYPQLNLMTSEINNSNHGPTLRFVGYDGANASSGNFKHWVIGTAATNATMLSFGYSPNNTNPHYGIGRGWSSGNNVAIMWISNDRHVYTENSFRAPQFTDSDNTGYYLNPASTSNLNALTTNTRAKWGMSRYTTSRESRTGDQNYWTGTHGWGTGDGTWATAFKGGFSGWDIWGSNTDHPQGAGYIHAQGIVSGQHFSTSDGARGYGWQMVGATNATSNRYWARGKWSTSISGWKEFAMYGGGGSGDLRASIFYDSDNTGYYGNFASTSRLNTLETIGRTVIGGRFDYNAYNSVGSTRLHFGGGNSDANGNYYIGTNLNNYGGNYTKLDLRWHTGIRMGAQPGYGGIRFYNNEDLSSEIMSIGRGDTNIRIETSLRVPIVYDSNSTGYYVDPASTSRFSRIDFGNSSYYIRSGSWGMRNQTPYGYIEFGPANSSHAHIYTNLTNFYFNKMIQVNGGSQINTSDVRGNIFYTKNNTGYYFDGDGVNSTRFEGVNDRTRAQLGQAASRHSSASAYMRRPNFTSNQDYWTGAMGWGTQDMNNVFNWGSGPIDSWSNPGNQPSGTSHWVGVQASHYSNNSSRYGWQLVGGPITNLRFRSTWGGFRSWRTVPVLDENNGNGGSMYAGRYYDSNNTGYYADPASTSNFNSLQVQGTLTARLPWSSISSKPASWLDSPVLVESRAPGGVTFPSGFYQSYQGTGNPTGTWFNFINVRHSNTGNGHGYQAGMSYYDNNFWFRSYSGGTTANYLSWEFALASGGTTQTKSGVLQSNASLRAPIFYDSNNTGYRMDPAGNSIMNQMNLGDSIYQINQSTWFGFHAANQWRVVTSGVERLEVNNSQIYMTRELRCTQDVIAFYSDERLKDNLGKIESPLDKISKLDAFYYVNNDLAKEKGFEDDKKQIGLSAQQVKEVMPEVVHSAPFDTDFDEDGNMFSTSGEDYLTLKYDRLVPLLVEGIKEQTEIVKAQQREIDELKEMVKLLLNK